MSTKRKKGPTLAVERPRQIGRDAAEKIMRLIERLTHPLLTGSYDDGPKKPTPGSADTKT